MTKRILLMLFAGAAILLASCSKEPGPDAPGDGRSGVTIRFRTAEPLSIQTKAESIGTGTDDVVDRLDVYVYKNYDQDQKAHFVSADPAGLDLDEVAFTDYDIYNTKYAFIAIANLDEATANYLAGLTKDQIKSYNGGLIPLSAGNYRAHRPIMGGTGTCSVGRNYYSSAPDDGNRNVEITLYRYVARIDIEKITADFEDTSMMNRDVIVKSIAWINQVNALRPLVNWPIGTQNNDPGNIFGSRSTYLPNTDFGNPTYPDSYHYGSTNEVAGGVTSMQSSFSLASYGATGAMAASFPYLVNNNYQQASGVLNIDATGARLTDTYHAFAGESGRICSSANPGQSHELTVNRQFYVMPVARNSWNTRLCTTFAGQDDTMKLVIEVEIDGTTHYYPIRALYIQPNTVYTVQNITLKGIGSEYSNFISPQAAPASYAGPVPLGLNALVIDNIDLGATDGLGAGEIEKEERL